MERVQPANRAMLDRSAWPLQEIIIYASVKWHVYILLMTDTTTHWPYKNEGGYGDYFFLLRIIELNFQGPGFKYGKQGIHDGMVFAAEPVW